ncbi:MAG: heterocycloanthracin/sonorensin family bacteriocin [Lachnospiraceae bacterium]|nr:heterocycloanthracin/sonorensin family bacteriocin [Lachnospiraceae bacterium]
MDKQGIKEYICRELSLEEQKIALDFVEYLESKKVKFVKDNGYWKDKIYYLISYNDKGVCYIAIKDPEEEQNHWTVWSDDMGSKWLEENQSDTQILEVAWRHIGHCGRCGSCAGGRSKIIFGKNFDDVCGCTFRIDNPSNKDLSFMKKMVDIRMREILDWDK